MSFRDEFCLKKQKLKHIALKVFLDVQQCRCSESVHCAALRIMYGFVVGWWLCALFLWFILIFCLSTCWMHLEETAVECGFLVGRGILRYLSGQRRQKEAVALLWVLFLFCLWWSWLEPDPQLSQQCWDMILKSVPVGLAEFLSSVRWGGAAVRAVLLGDFSVGKQRTGCSWFFSIVLPHFKLLLSCTFSSGLTHSWLFQLLKECKHTFPD